MKSSIGLAYESHRKRHLQLLIRVPYYEGVHPRGGRITKKTNIMNKLIQVATPAIIAIAAVLLFVRLPLSADTFAGIFTSVLVLALMALEYRINWKRLFSR